MIIITIVIIAHPVVHLHPPGRGVRQHASVRQPAVIQDDRDTEDVNHVGLYHTIVYFSVE